MKKAITLSVFFCWSILSFGTTRFVDNSYGAPTTYSTIQAAVDASAPNDTIYIQASITQYSGATVTKPLVFVGEGALPNQQMQRTSKVALFILAYSNDYSSNASGSKFYGLYIQSLRIGNATVNPGQSNTSCSCFPSGFFINPYTGISNITCERNYIHGFSVNWDGYHSAHFNIVFKNNILNELFGRTLFNSVFSNNIITGMVQFLNYGFGTGNTFSHNTCYLTSFRFEGANVVDNLFDRHGSAYASDNFNVTDSYAYFHRNVFAYPLAPNTSNTTFGENLFTNQGQVIQGRPTYNDVIATTYSAPGPFWNLHLNATSIGVGYGSDGTDVGIYGGTDPWIDEVSTDDRFRYFAAPRQWPVLKEVNILNPNTTSNGTLNIQIKAKSQN